MTQKYILEVVSRSKELKNLSQVRQEGKIPGVVYGHDFKNIDLLVNTLKLEKTYQQLGESSLIDLVIDGKDAVKTVIKNLDRDPINGRVIHVDFYKVKMDKKMTAEVSLEFVGQPRTIKDLGGILVKNLDSLEIECLPGDLIPFIEVDLSKLDELGDVIRVGDLVVPQGVKILSESDEAVAIAEEPRQVAIEEESLQTEDSKIEGDKKDDKQDHTEDQEKKNEEPVKN